MNVNGKRCFFIGHRDAPEAIYGDLLRAVESCVVHDRVVEFVVGHYGHFDRMAARAVMEIKKKYPTIVLTMLRPYHPGIYGMELPDGFDGSWYPPNMETVPRRAAIARANRYAVEASSCLIAYLRYPGSNTRALVEYARRRAIAITEL